MRDLNDLAFFASVVEHGGFAAAGRALGIPKSRLSRRLAELEDDLGVRLLQRSTRRIAVTEVGQQFLVHCRAMLAEVQAAEETVASRRAEPRGLVRLSCPVDLAQNLVAPCLPDFLAAYPRVRLQMLVSNRRFDLPGEHIDIALRVRPEPDMDPQWVTRPLARLRKLMVAAPAYLETRGRPQRQEELRGHDTLSLGELDGAQSWQFHPVADDRADPLAAVRVDVQPRLLCSEFQVLLHAALAGRGIVGLPEALCGPAICDGRLEVVLPQWQATDVVMHLVYTARRGLLPAVRVLIDFLVERLPQMVAATAAPRPHAN